MLTLPTWVNINVGIILYYYKCTWLKFESIIFKNLKL